MDIDNIAKLMHVAIVLVSVIFYCRSASKAGKATRTRSRFRGIRS